MFSEIRRTKSKIVAVASASLAVAVAACGDLTGVPASLPTSSGTGVVYALNGAPSGAPTALYVFSGTLLPATASFIFDIAFDIDNSGNAVLLPQRVVATGLSSTHSVGLQKVGIDFDAITSAPKSGYKADSSVVVAPNQVVVVQSTDPNACGISITGTTLYAKLAITAVDVLARQLTVRYTVNPNCGFYSFAPGIPKD